MFDRVRCGPSSAAATWQRRERPMIFGTTDPVHPAGASSGQRTDPRSVFRSLSIGAASSRKRWRSDAIFFRAERPFRRCAYWVSAFAACCSCFFTFLAFDSRQNPSASSFLAFAVWTFFTSFGPKAPSPGSAFRSSRSASSRQSIEANVAAAGVPSQPDEGVVVVVGRCVVLVAVLVVVGRAVELVVEVVVVLVVGALVEVVVVDVVVVVVLVVVVPAIVVVVGDGKVPTGASYAPMSQRARPSLLPSMGRGMRRWSVAGARPALSVQPVGSPASPAGVDPRSACVCVGPPFLASPARPGLSGLAAVPTWFPALAVTEQFVPSPTR